MTLEFAGVEKRYPDGTAALAAVSFCVPKGQLCAVLGPSGAGKSTLLRCVNGLIRPTGGCVCINGVPVDAQSLADIRPTVAMIHQGFNLVGRSTVAMNVIAGALPKVGTVAALFGIFPQTYRRKACALIEDVGLSELHLKRRVDKLSGGQQQRVGIARAFMLDPEIILADEPVASLDPQTSADILALLAREARTRGTTVLCSLHQVELAIAFADRIVAMRAGRLAFDGPPQALTANVIEAIYGSANVARFPSQQPSGA
ncbi:MAG TPA: phosphonate ABC transporter ATP-binding protein [Rhizomicrobium sp.]|nr:phosphonate ABC transporter ATP-binding protein [Rhizomicrobium sp.]